MFTCTGVPGLKTGMWCLVFGELESDIGECCCSTREFSLPGEGILISPLAFIEGRSDWKVPSTEAAVFVSVPAKKTFDAF